MCRGVRKKLLSIVMAVAMVLSVVIVQNKAKNKVVEAAGWYYDVEAAMAYAEANWDKNNDTIWCAEFVRNCLRAGGLNIANLGDHTTDVTRAIESLTGISGQDLVLDSNGNATYDLDGAILQRGDVVLQWCYTCQNGPHILICSGYDSYGNAVYYAHNGMLHNQTYNLSINTAKKNNHSPACNITGRVFRISQKRVTDSPLDLGYSFYSKIYVDKNGTTVKESNNSLVYEQYKENDNSFWWRFVRNSNGSYRIMNVKTGNYIDDSDFGREDCSPIKTYISNNSTAQNYYIHSVGGGKVVLEPECAPEMVLDIGGDNFTKIHLYEYVKDNANQQFTLQMDDTITTPADLGESFDSKIIIKGGEKCVVEKDEKLVYESLLSTAQDAAEWTFIRNNNGSYCIKNKKTGNYIDDKDYGNEDGSVIKTYMYNRTSAQRFFLYLVEDGKVIIEPECAPGMVLDIGGDDFTKIHLYEYVHGNNNQRYRLEPISQEIKATSIELNKTEILMEVGQEYNELRATLFPSNTTDIVIWTSNKASVATVDTFGKIKAVAAGSVKITATAGNISRDIIVTVVNDHVWSDGVTENSKTCTESGRIKYICKVCGKIKYEEVQAQGHSYGDPAWTWTGYTKAVAKFTCKNNSSHTQSVIATITNKVTKAATCDTAGVRTYTATATFNGKTYTTTKTETIAAKGHNYGNPVWTWTGYTKAVAKFTCKNNSSHTKTVTATITNKVTKQATVTASGTKTYTATVTFNGKKYTNTKSETVYIFNKSKTGIQKYNNVLYYTKNGIQNTSFTGFAKYGNDWYYVVMGKVDTSKKDVIKGTVNGQSGWWYVSGSKVQFTDSVEKNSNGWWDIRNGKVDFNYTGFAKNSNGWWYCEKGKVNFNKKDVIKGTVNGQSGWWYVSGGKVQFVDSVEKNSNGWWAIKNGKVDFNFTGIAKNSNGQWYCKGGKVQFGYTGTVKYNNKTYKIKGGKVVN